MEEYIFIILAILLSIVGAVSRSKNKKVTGIPADNSEATRTPNFFDQFLGESIFNEEPVRSQNFVPVSEPPVIPEKIKTKVASKPFLNPELEGKRKEGYLMKAKSIGNAKSKITCSENKNVRQIMNGFTLKKAFVYSEIIQRKY